MRRPYCSIAIILLFFFAIAGVQSQTLFNGVGHIPQDHQETWNVAGLKLKTMGNYICSNSNKINPAPGFDLHLPKQWYLKSKFIVSDKNHVPQYFSESTYNINQNNDALIIFTDEQIKREVKFGIAHKIFRSAN